MIKKVFFSLLILLAFSCKTFAEDVPIKVSPKELLTTCNPKPAEGDYVDFVVVQDTLNIKKGDIIIGLITSREENGFSGTVGTLYIEQFKYKNKDLKGVILQKGNGHPLYFEYNPLLILSQFSVVRGGEAFLRPNQDIYTIFIEDK